MSKINIVMNDTKILCGRPARLYRADGAAIAEKLFHGIGYDDQLGVAEICDALGVRQPALYRVACRYHYSYLARFVFRGWERKNGSRVA